MDPFLPVHKIERKASERVHVVREAAHKSSSTIQARLILARSVVKHVDKLSTERNTALGKVGAQQCSKVERNLMHRFGGHGVQGHHGNCAQKVAYAAGIRHALENWPVGMERLAAIKTTLGGQRMHHRSPRIHEIAHWTDSIQRETMTLEPMVCVKMNTEQRTTNCTDHRDLALPARLRALYLTLQVGSHHVAGRRRRLHCELHHS